MRRKYSSQLRPLRALISATGVRLGCLVVAVLSFVGAPSAVAADPSVPANVDSHLQRLIQRGLSKATPLAQADTQGIPGRFDASGRVLVHIHLDGTQSIEAVEQALNTQQIRIQAKNATYRHGIMAAYLTPDQVVVAASLSGVRR